MAQITFKGAVIQTKGDLPKVGAHAPLFHLNSKNGLKSLKDFIGKKVIATLPKIETQTCSMMSHNISKLATKYPQVKFLIVSTDSTDVQINFCDAQKIDNVTTLSVDKDNRFGADYGLLMTDGPIKDHLARSIIVLDENDRVVFTELVSEIAHEPNYAPIEPFLK